jgi:hypothetical protein
MSVRKIDAVTRVILRSTPKLTKANALSAGGKKEVAMYAGIRQAKAKPGMAEKLTSRIKEGAIPIISDVPGFEAYYVVYAPDDTVTAISIFDNAAAAEESPRMDREGACAHARGPCDRGGRAGDRAYAGMIKSAKQGSRSGAGSGQHTPYGGSGPLRSSSTPIVPPFPAANFEDARSKTS